MISFDILLVLLLKVSVTLYNYPFKFIIQFSEKWVTFECYKINMNEMQWT